MTFNAGEPVCLDKMASYSACLGPELATRFSAAAAQCHFDQMANHDDEEDEEEIVGDRQGKGGRKGKGEGKGRPGKGGKGGRRPGKGKGRPGKGKGDSSEEEEGNDVFDVVDFVRNDVEERTCVYRQLG